MPVAKGGKAYKSPQIQFYIDWFNASSLKDEQMTTEQNVSKSF